jgi:ketosteroid isomerase-like protein
MFPRCVLTLTFIAGLGGSAVAADFDAGALHEEFMAAFNDRQWDAVKSMLAEDSVFHRANAAEVYSGPDAIVGHFEQPIGGEWNVKFVRLETEDQITGNDGRVVERGDFAITAGADDSACYAGSYMATWAPQEGGDAWRLQVFSWQDVETGPENCK